MSTEAQINRQNIRGLEFPCSIDFTKERIEASLDYLPRDDDIIISTYPKTGTTWVQYIVFEILNDGKVPPSRSEMRKIIPFMETCEIKAVEQLVSPRILKYHLPYNKVPYNPKTKYITIIRNPYDVVVSYYYFLRQITTVDLTLDDLFNAFLTGKCIYGDYFDHILSWYQHRNNNNVLVLSYEKMKKDPRTGLILISQFLGYDLRDKEELIERILKHTSFDYMKANVETGKRQCQKDAAENNSVDFFRCGNTGQGKQELTETQLKALKDRINKKLKDSDIHRLWT